MISSRPVAPRRIGQAVAAALLPALLAGCEAEAVELVREIEAARGECTREGLRASDEECVRMMERYTSMGTDLVHTYLGGLRALDMALDRMPPPGFDTAGVGYAISPELREGDPAGIGGSPRLVPGRAAYTYGYAPAAADEPVSWRSDPRTRRAAAPAVRSPADRPRAGYYGFSERSSGRGEYSDRSDPRGPSRPYRGAEHDRWRERDRYDRYDRGGYYADRYGSYGFSMPFGLGGWAPFGTGWGAGFDDRGFAPFGFGAPYGGWPYFPLGSGSLYGSDGYGRYPYGGYGPWDGYAPGVGGWSSGAYDPYGRYPGYDPYARPYMEDDYGRYAVPGSVSGYDDRPPAEAWGYDDAPRGTAAAPVDAPPPAAGDPAEDAGQARTAAPSRPAPHRPGILLPPEERLRRPWLDD